MVGLVTIRTRISYNECSSKAPDAVGMGLLRVPAKSTKKKIQTFNANYLSLRVRCDGTKKTCS